ncbi:hypothetical protein LEP1GSC188_0964 [Leptospira weilii serovar Topaz str. LT2116]|uniref:Uncharacterized protein n=1 Tax=Leptospira weilii serovar Topaz str. LT2116 TaxID=1088540 RepID=M3FNN4_9LEPT|nr:hypothetical protein LEP1GSC188_0964 [Leptospira weilii serovar Topaz str. LT2116]
MSQNFDGNIIVNFLQNEGIPTDYFLLIIYRLSNRLCYC